MKEIFNGILEFDWLDVGWKPGSPGGKPPWKTQIYNPSATFLWTRLRLLGLGLWLILSLKLISSHLKAQLKTYSC